MCQLCVSYVFVVSEVLPACCHGPLEDISKLPGGQLAMSYVWGTSCLYFGNTVMLTLWSSGWA